VTNQSSDGKTRVTLKYTVATLGRNVNYISNSRNCPELNSFY